MAKQYRFPDGSSVFAVAGVPNAWGVVRADGESVTNPEAVPDRSNMADFYWPSPQAAAAFLIGYGPRDDARQQLEAVTAELDYFPHAVRVREGCGPENIAASVATNLARLESELAQARERAEKAEQWQEQWKAAFQAAKAERDEWKQSATEWRQRVEALNCEALDRPTLRDTFATKALGAAYLLESRAVGKDGFPEGRSIAEYAYTLADEMLAVRSAAFPSPT
jgi:hypothetical protein